MNPKTKNIIEWIYCILIALVLSILFRYFIGTPTVVKQASMYDTLVEGQRLWLNRWVRTVKGEYHRGDIITFEAPSDPIITLAEANNDYPVARYDNEPKGIIARFIYYVLELNKTSYIKRVIGVAGDHVQIKEGKVYLNGKELYEPYLNEGTTTEGGVYTDVIVPKGYVFAMGDNRPHSTDCRSFGCVPIEKIESRVAFRFWPLSKFGKVDK